MMLDSDLAQLYGVTTSALNQAVERNRDRFPDDFMVRLTAQEARSLKSQFVISNAGRGGRRRSSPRAFTEQGVAMLSSVLRSDRAVKVNIEIMRAFVRLRRVYGEFRELSSRIDELELKMDQQFGVVFAAIRALMEPAGREARPIGFLAPRK